MPRVNLVSNPSFKTDTTGWVITGTAPTIARVTTDAFYGTSCLQVTKDAASNAGAAWGSATVAPNTVYTGSAYVKIPTGQEESSLIFYIYWYDATSTLISSSGGTLTLLTDLDGWVRLSATGTSPANAAFGRVRVVQPTAGTTGKTFLMDAVLLEQSSFAGQYLDELSQGQENSAMDLALKRVPVPHLTGAELNADVSLGSLVFNTVDEYGVVWVITQVEGWWNLPTPVMPNVDRGFADGTYDVRGRFESRAITLSGVILPPSRDKLPAARQRLLTAANLVYRGDWLRLDEGPVKACWVRLVGVPSIDTVNARGRTEFSLTLRASDPVKYEWLTNDADGKKLTALTNNNMLTAGGLTDISNSGNTDVTAVFQIDGPLYGPNASIENVTTGQAMTIVGSLRPARSYVVTARDTSIAGVSTVTLGTTGRHNVKADDEIVLSSVGGSTDTYTLTSAVGSGTAVTYTSSSAASTQPFSIGTQIVIGSGFTPSGYSTLTSTITAIGGTSGGWTFTIPGTTTGGSSGTATGTLGTGYNDTWVVTAVTASTISFYSGLQYEATVSSLTGTLTTDADHLEIDTYDREVAVNGIVEGSRSQVDTLTDWIYLQAGTNRVGYYDDNQSVTFIKSYSRSSGTTTITTLGDHDFYPSDSVYVMSPTAIKTSVSTVKASNATTAAVLYIPDAGGTVTTTTLGPVVYTDTRGQVITSVAWDLTNKIVTLTTESKHGMTVGDYVTVDGGTTTVNLVDVGVATSTSRSISTYGFNTTTDVLTLVTASATSFTVGDEIEVSNMGGDFDGIFAIASISGTTITVSAPSTNVTITAGTSAPSEATLRRVYRIATTPTTTTLTYVKKSGTGTAYSTFAVPAPAGKVYQLGTGVATVAYRSGWIS